MQDPLKVARGALWGLILACAGSAAIAAPSDPAALQGFDRFARQIGPFCAVGPARACFTRSFAYADTDHDGTLSLEEVQRMQSLVNDWALANQGSLAEPDRRGLMLGLLALQLVGLDHLFASYDVNHDGKLTPAELSADVRLDDRPLSRLIQDPKAIDWPQLKARLGPAAFLLNGLDPAAG